MLKGTSHFEAEEISFDVGEGELVYIPKFLPYDSYWYGDPQVKFISLGFSFFPENEPRFYHLQKVEIDEDVSDIITSITTGSPVNCKDAGLLFTILGKVLPSMTYTIKKPPSGIMKKACDIIESDTRLSVGEVARRCGVSESGLYAIFRSEGTTPVDFRQRLLCERAAVLLCSTDMTVEEISDHLGFSTPSYFRRVLKKHFRQTPKEIRNNIPV
jgi:AraC-like DNA-binding protein